MDTLKPALVYKNINKFTDVSLKTLLIPEVLIRGSIPWLSVEVRQSTMRAEVWTPVFLLNFVMVFTATAPVPYQHASTTDPVMDQIREAAAVDFNFIQTDLRDLEQKYADNYGVIYSKSVSQLGSVVNQTYEETIPKNTSAYNPLCLELIYEDIANMMEELNEAIAVCANISFSAVKKENNLAQFHVIISSIKELSNNLTDMVNTCLVKFPKESWDRVECVLREVDSFAQQDPTLRQFKRFNAEMTGHLTLLDLDMTRCHRQALRRVVEIKQAILIDLDICKALSS